MAGGLLSNAEEERIAAVCPRLDVSRSPAGDHSKGIASGLIGRD